MPAGPFGHRSDLGKFVERQMRNWEISRSQQPERTPEAEAAPQVADFVCISRSLGSGGSDVAQQLGERLHWPVFDRELLQAMAGDDHVRRQLYERMDERDVTWLEDAVRWLMQGEFRRDDYFYKLSETVLALARQGSAIFLGRGADLILPRDRGLRVRVVAPLEKRVAAVAQRAGMSEALARAEVERADQERGEFRKRHFGRAASDLSNWDLIISLDRFTPADAVELVQHALRIRGNQV